MKSNRRLLNEISKIIFHYRKDGTIVWQKHSKYELGLNFIKQAIKIHGEKKFLYGLVNYKSSNSKVSIICGRAGHVFTVLPSSHLNNKSVCPKCAGRYRYTQQDFLDRCKEVHGDSYLYDKALYVQANTHVVITCPKHGDFTQTPSSHLNSFSGCPKCAGHNQDVLYLLRCKDTGWYKIGITTGNIHTRMASIGGNLEETYHVVCEVPRTHETILHKQYAKDREYNPCVKSGNTEFFSLNEEQVAQVRQYMASIAIKQKSI